MSKPKNHNIKKNEKLDHTYLMKVIVNLFFILYCRAISKVNFEVQPPMV